MLSFFSSVSLSLSLSILQLELDMSAREKLVLLEDMLALLQSTNRHRHRLVIGLLSRRLALTRGLGGGWSGGRERDEDTLAFVRRPSGASPHRENHRAEGGAGEGPSLLPRRAGSWGWGRGRRGGSRRGREVHQIDGNGGGSRLSDRSFLPALVEGAAAAARCLGLDRRVTALFLLVLVFLRGEG
jgi:hypothetical protein